MFCVTLKLTGLCEGYFSSGARNKLMGRAINWMEKKEKVGIMNKRRGVATGWIWTDIIRKTYVSWVIITKTYYIDKYVGAKKRTRKTTLQYLNWTDFRLQNES